LQIAKRKFEKDMSAESLIHRYLDDRSGLEAAELDELIALLRAEPARAVALREQLLLDDLVAQKLSVDRRNFPAQVGQRIADYHRGEEEMDNQVSDLRALAESEFERPSPWSGSSPWVKYIALAATILIAAVIFVPRFLPRTPQAVAKVTAVEGDVRIVVGMGVSKPSAGSAILTKQFISTLNGGSLTVEYADRTSIQINAGTQLSFDLDETHGGKFIGLQEGEIVAAVSPQDAGSPMTVKTPHAIATVVGTQFRLTVTADQTLLDVTEGMVVLDRLDDGQSIEVEANETGLASGELLQLKPLAWPEDHQSVAYLLSPFDFLNRTAPVTASRNPETGNLREADLLPIGSAAMNEFTASAELSGGLLKSDHAGTDLWHVLNGQSELTLEVVVSTAKADQGGPAPIVALADDGQAANLLLAQEGGELLFRLQTDAGHESQAIRFDGSNLKEPVHLAIAYRDGKLAAYRDGIEVKSLEVPSGNLAWREGPLTLGGEASGMSNWQGTIEALAIHGRCLDAQEIARNARSFRLLAGKSPK
jgi:hypothetical protein